MVLPFIEYRALRVFDALIDLSQLGWFFNLDAEVSNTRRLIALADGEIDPRIFEHPFCVVALLDRGPCSKQG